MSPHFLQFLNLSPAGSQKEPILKHAVAVQPLKHHEHIDSVWVITYLLTAKRERQKFHTAHSTTLLQRVPSVNPLRPKTPGKNTFKTYGQF